jgi:hypothetical protein
MIVSMETGARAQQGTEIRLWGLSSVGTPDRRSLELSKWALLQRLGAQKQERERTGPRVQGPGLPSQPLLLASSRVSPLSWSP